MIVDSSAVVAILLNEDHADDLVKKIAGEPHVGIGIPSLVETTIVLSAKIGADARGLVARFLQESGIVAIPFGEAHWAIAVDAWLRFGKGRHPAQLNFGDCLAYAMAKVSGRPLLCVGAGFATTDVALA